MITFLSGKAQNINLKENRFILLTPGGVGYLIHATADLALSLQEGQVLSIPCHLVVREDAMDLYGFKQDTARELFLRLIKISGVGPKIALIMVSNMTIEDLSQAVAEKNIKLLTRIPGVGPKLAQRLLLELGAVVAGIDVPQAALPSAAGDALGALIKLGYDEKKARDAIKSLDHAQANTEQLIKQALKLLLPV